MPFLTLVDRLVTAGAGGFAGVDERCDGGAAALVCRAPAAAGVACGGVRQAARQLARADAHGLADAHELGGFAAERCVVEGEVGFDPAGAFADQEQAADLQRGVVVDQDRDRPGSFKIRARSCRSRCLARSGVNSKSRTTRSSRRSSERWVTPRRAVPAVEDPRHVECGECGDEFDCLLAGAVTTGNAWRSPRCRLPGSAQAASVTQPSAYDYPPTPSDAQLVVAAVHDREIRELAASRRTRTFCLTRQTERGWRWTRTSTTP